MLVGDHAAGLFLPEEEQQLPPSEEEQFSQALLLPKRILPIPH